MRATLATCALLLASASQLHAAPLPATGMTMNAVEQTMGTPREKTGPVGRPPITRWVYDGVVVVFEHNKVVQSVQITGGAPAARPTPAPAMPTVPKAPAPTPETKAPKPAPAAPSDAQIRNNEAIRRAAEQEADEKARAATEAARKAADAKAKAAATTAAKKAAAETPPATNTPASTPEAAPTTTPAATGTETKDPSYSFDPATGRIIIN